MPRLNGHVVVCLSAFAVQSRDCPETRRPSERERVLPVNRPVDSHKARPRRFLDSSEIRTSIDFRDFDLAEPHLSRWPTTSTKTALRSMPKPLREDDFAPLSEPPEADATCGFSSLPSWIISCTPFPTKLVVNWLNRRLRLSWI